LDIIDGFDYLAAHLSDKATQILEEYEDEDADLVEILMEEIGTSSVLCFSITTSGVGCGPASSTVYLAVDFCANS